MLFTLSSSLICRLPTESFDSRWAANSEKYDSGKLFFIDSREAHTQRQRAIFFDDNLRLSEFHSTKHLIVDIRDIGSTSLPSYMRIVFLAVLTLTLIFLPYSNEVGLRLLLTD